MLSMALLGQLQWAGGLMTAAGIDSTFEGSDHCPIWLDVDLPQELPQGHPVPAMALHQHASGKLDLHLHQMDQHERLPSGQVYFACSRQLKASWPSCTKESNHVRTLNWANIWKVSYHDRASNCPGSTVVLS